ncbi:hypothetical protein AN477_21765 [Alicyclobacillus ferrooxydans]|uniref:Uncharacterized protein n=1 Tax=Alicyclobacillus ferrooxydans TaxID=471514 RepID=A0A0N8PN95_9BACL|nr:hypothetical protein AN477_21765 [Alicyclobacillus ferrooxydans]
MRDQLGASIEESAPRRSLRIGLGLLWAVDALLQMQPGMFHPAFYGNLPSNLMPSILQDLRETSPSWITWAVRTAQWFFIHWPVAVNLGIILLQLVLAFLLSLRVPPRWRNIGLVVSVLWGLTIWVFGEALAGVGSWGATFYAGFPGSAFLYACAGGFLLLPAEKWHEQTLTTLITRTTAGFLWLSGILQLLPVNGQWDRGAQLDVFANSGFQSQPGILSAPVMTYSIWSSAHPVASNTLLGLTLLGAGCAVWFWRTAVWLRVGVYVWLFLAWWFGMDFGYLFSGLSTDPNTPPILFAMLWAVRPRSRTTSKLEVASRVSHTSATG